MKALNRKLLRDLRSLWSQALAIALVVAGGVATLIMAASTVESLQRTRASFYADYAMADIYAHLKRAPQGLAARLQTIPGVTTVDTRVAAPARLEMADFNDPVNAQLLSIPNGAQPRLHRLFLRAGRLPHPSRHHEVVVSEAFANAHGLGPGDSLGVIVNGRRQTLHMVGVALSPEFIYQIQAGALIPDYQRYAILWMNRSGLASAYDMDGAFNDVALTLTRDAHLPQVIAALDRLLARYGGLGAYPREDQLSHRYLSQEFHGLETMARIFPTVFLGVAAFLLNVVVARLVALQREQLATLKAFGYSNAAVGWHYAKLVGSIVLLGVVLGLLGGLWMGHGMSLMYMEFFRFPYLSYRLAPEVVLLALGVALLAGGLGTLRAVHAAARLPPAQAMAPEPPSAYRPSLLEALFPTLSQLTRIILRSLSRRPVRALLGTLGIALAGAMVMVGSFQEDAIDFLVSVQFGLAQREDITVNFTEAVPHQALHELAQLPGVRHAEPFRGVAVRLHAGHRSERTSIQGLPAHGHLQQLLDTHLQTITLPPSGLLLTEHLAGELGVQPGDQLMVEVLEGARPQRQVPLMAVVQQYVGSAAYMEHRALNRLLREGEVMSGALLAVDAAYTDEILRALSARPRVASTTMQEDAIQSFFDTMAETILIFSFINTLLAGSIAFGVIYNSARISLSERERELASLRVLGFTRAEVAYILLGELGLLTLLAIPLGFALGYGLCALLAQAMASELYRIPLVVESSTYALSASVVLLATLISSGVVWSRLGRLDLVEVLKTRE